MKKLFDNGLLVWSIAFIVAYWTIGSFVPGVYVSGAMSLLMLSAGAITLARYGPPAWKVVVHRERNTLADGAHLAAYGVALIAAGSVYTGLFSLAWLSQGTPESWTSTVYSSFGRGLMASGYFMLWLSPDISKNGFKLPSRWWLFVLIASVTVVVFLLGYLFGVQQTEAALLRGG